MIINEETKQWAFRKLSRFYDWQGYPTNKDAVDGLVRGFLRLVYNQTYQTILDDLRKRDGLPPLVATKLEPDINDVDWILDRIQEECERFPMLVEIRRMYGEKITPVGGMSPDE